MTGAARGRGWALRVALLLAGTALGLGLVELGARGLGLAPQTKSLGLDALDTAYRRSDNPVLGFELKPGYRSDTPDFVTTYPFINEHGQRDRSRSLEKPPGVRRVLVLGDSVVEGSGVRDLQDTIPGQLASLLGDDVEVLNFGVSGYCTLAEVELLEERGLAFSPDVVVVVFVENDFDNFNTLLMDLAVSQPARPWERWLFLNSDLVRTLALRFGWFGVTPPGDPFDRMRDAIGGQNVVDGLARLRALAEREGFVPLVGIWPHFSFDVVTDPHPMGDGSGDLVVERLARTAGIPTFRFSDAYREHHRTLAETTPRAAYSVQSDTMHPTPLAARVAAEALRAEIARAVAAGLPAPTPVDESAVELARIKGARAPERFKIEANRGTLLASRGEYEAAIEAFERALEEEISPGWQATLYYNLGNAARLAGDSERARAAYRRAVVLRPNQTPAKFRLSQLDAAQAEEVPDGVPTTEQD